jgi:hypothetical protein
MGIKQQLVPQLVTGHMKWLFLWAHSELCNEHKNRACYCELNIKDAFCEPASPLSRQNETHLFPCASDDSQLKETRSFNLHLLYLDERAKTWGPPVSTGNGLLHYPLHTLLACL